jgi:hypothetical protein
MNGSLRVGRWLFAIAMVFFGIQFFIFCTSMHGPVPGPPWTHGMLALDWLACLGFVLAGVSLATGWMARLVSALLGAVLLVYVLCRWVPSLLAQLHNPEPWTAVFEILAMVGGAWVIAAGLPADERFSQPWDGAVLRMAGFGRWLIAISLVVFAVQHFLYAGFVATLVPAWIPARLFWAYFTAVAFIAAALAIATTKMLRLGGILLGAMFLIWVVILHVPRVAGAMRNGDEVTSLFVCLAMSGVGFALAGVFGNRLEGRGA